MSFSGDLDSKLGRLAGVPVRPCPGCGGPRERVIRGGDFKPRCFACNPIGKRRANYDREAFREAVEAGGTWPEVAAHYNRATGEDRNWVHIAESASRRGLVRGHIPDSSVRSASFYLACTRVKDEAEEELSARIAAAKAFPLHLNRPPTREDWGYFEEFAARFRRKEDVA